MDHRLSRIVILAALLAAGITAPGCKQQPAGTGAGRNEGAAASGRTPYYHGLIVEYRSNLEADPHNLAAMIGLANALADSGQCREAVRYYEQALKLDPHNADVITDLGICFRNLGMIDRALAAYTRALKVEPAHPKALFNLGSVYGIDKQDYAKAIAVWEQLLRTAPNHPKAAYVQENLLVFKKAQRGASR